MKVFCIKLNVFVNKNVFSFVIVSYFNLLVQPTFFSTNDDSINYFTKQFNKCMHV